MTKKTFKSYEDYLGEQNTNPTAKYYDSLNRIEKEFRTQKSTYGTSAEALGTRGLSDSGYASFLDAHTERKRAAQLSDAESELQREQTQLRGGYEDYLTKEKQRLYNLERNVQNAILSSETVDAALAFDMAKSAGLSEEHALAVAKRAVAVNVNNKKVLIMNYIRKQMISPSNAVLYGEAYGLPKQALEELRLYAEKVQKRGEEVDLDGTLGSYPTISPD